MKEPIQPVGGGGASRGWGCKRRGFRLLAASNDPMAEAVMARLQLRRVPIAAALRMSLTFYLAATDPEGVVFLPGGLFDSAFAGARLKDQLFPASLPAHLRRKALCLRFAGVAGEWMVGYGMSLETIRQAARRRGFQPASTGYAEFEADATWLGRTFLEEGTEWWVAGINPYTLLDTGEPFSGEPAYTVLALETGWGRLLFAWELELLCRLPLEGHHHLSSQDSQLPQGLADSSP